MIKESMNEYEFQSQFAFNQYIKYTFFLFSNQLSDKTLLKSFREQ